MKIKSPSLLFNSEARLMAFCGGARQIGSMTKATPHEGDSDLGSGYRCNKQRANWALGLGGVATHLQILTFIILALFLGRGPLYAQPDPPSRPILFVHGWCGSAYDWAPFFDPANQYRLSALFPAGLYTNTDVYLVEYNRKAKTIGFWKEDNPELGSKTKLESVGTTVPSDARFFALNFIDPDPSSTNPLDPVNVARSSVLNKAYEIAVVAQYIEQLTYSKQINIIAHSMGGLDSRAYVENLASVGDCYDYGTSAGASFYNYTVGTCLPGQGAAAYGGDIANIITLDTPHNGSPLANSWASALSGLPDYSCRSTITTNSSELVPGNVMLDSLNYNTLYAIGNNDTHPNNLTTRIQAIEDYDSDNNPPWLTSGLSDGVVLQTSQSVVHNVLGSANSAYLTDITREYADVTIALTPQCNVNIGFQTPFPMIHPLSCLGALSFTEVTAAQQLANDTVPWISSWSVTPSALSLGNSFTIQYTATDLSASTLSSTQFWRAPDTSGQPGPWKQLPSKSLSGNGPTTVTSTDTPLTIGLYWYGSELLDAAGNGHWQQSTSPVTVTAASTGTYTLTVNSVNPASGVGISVSPADNDAKGNGTTSFVRTYNQNTQVTLTALSTAGGNSFSSWTGCDQAPGIVCIVTMTAAKTVTANYTTSAGTFTLTVNSSNPSSGVGITVLPTDKNGSGNGTTSFSRTYNQATQVTLTAPATAGGNTFSSWTGCDDALGITCTVTMNAAKTVTANYTTASGSQIAAILLSSNFTLGSISVVTQGAPNLDFNFASGGTCTVGTAYSAGQTCTVEFSFTPRAPGQRMGAIVLVDGSGNVQATEYISGIGTGPEAVFAPGIISTVAGNGTPGYSGDGNGDGNAATSAELNQPLGVVVDSAGNIYIASYWTYSIRKVNASTGLISTVAGNGTIGFKYSGDGGAATSAEISSPDGVALDSAGNIYISVGLINRILKVNVSTGLISTVAGNGTGGYNGDGIAATSAELNQPVGVVVDSAGNIYIADRNNQRIRKVSASTGLISTVAGNGYVNSGTGGGGYNGDGITATNAELYFPNGIAEDSAGSMYIADSLNQRIRKVSASTSGLSFATTTVGSTSGDSPQTVTLWNNGNAALTFPIPSSGNNPSVSTNFTLNSAGGTACPLIGSTASLTGSLAAGTSCTLPISFAPTSTGSISGSLVLTDNNLNVPNATQTISFSGTSTGGTVRTTPTMTVTPSLPNISTAQALTVTVAVSGGGANPTPTGSVTLSGGGYTSAATTLSSGSATINIPAGSLATGSDTLTASYTPDSSSSSTYNTATGTSSAVTVTQAKTTPTVTVTPSASSITTAQPLTVTVAVSGGTGNPTPTGSVTLSGGGYTSAATTLNGASAMISIPAGSLTTGTDTLTVSYTPDSSSSSTYNTATGTSSAVTVTTPVKTTPTVAVTPFASSITTAQVLSVTITVTGGTGSPTPTGSVTLSGGGYTSVATTLSGGSATISIPAKSLTTGADTLTVSYTPDSASSSTYNSATGSNSVTVTAPAKTTPTVTVTPSASSITTAQALSVTVAVSGGTGSPTPTGSLTLTSGTYTSAAATLSSGSATINIPAGSLATGNDTLTVSYTPDSNSSSAYNSANGSAPVAVTNPAKTTPTVTVTQSSSSITTTQPLTVTVAVSGGSGNPTPTGSLTLTGGGYTSPEGTLSSGSATISIPAGSLAKGGDTLTATYTPDSSSSSTYNAATGTSSTVTVTQAKTAPTVTVTPSASSITTAQALSVTVAVSGGAGNQVPSGSVTLSGGGYTSSATTLSAGNASINIPAGSLATGSDTLTASYTPDTASSSTYNTANGSAPVAVTNPAKTTPAVTVTPSASSITTAQVLSVTVTVNGGTGNPTPTGSVTLSGGGYTSVATTLSGGSATISIPAKSLTTGADTLTVSYTPDLASSSTYNSATGSNSVTVTAPAKTTPTVTVTPSVSTITTAQALSVTVAVSDGTGNPTPTGSLTLTSGTYTSAAATLSSGSATISIPAGSLATGSDLLTVSYTPDSNSSSAYNSATGSAPVAVTNPAKTTPLVTVTPGSPSITTAQPLSVTVAVSGGTGNPTPTGSVTLSGGGYTSPATTLTSGNASISIPAGSLATGPDTLTVSYTPDSSSSSTYNSATGSSSVTVTTPAKTTPTVTVTPSASSITPAQSLTVTVAVSGATGNPTPTGSVTLSSGSYSVQQTLASGAASFTIAAGVLGNGSDTLTASYSGDAIYAVASSTTTVTVEPVSISTTTPSPVNPGSSTTSTVTLTGSNGYSGTMNLSCLLTTSPAGAQKPPTCALNPASVTLASGGSGTTTLTVNTTAASTNALARPTDQHLWKLGGGGAVLAAMLLFGIPLRRRRWTSMLALLLFVAASGAIGCGGGGGTGGGGGGGSSTPATTAGNYSFTVAATDSVNAKITASTTISVTVQ